VTVTIDDIVYPNVLANRGPSVPPVGPALSGRRHRSDGIRSIFRRSSTLRLGVEPRFLRRLPVAAVKQLHLVLRCFEIEVVKTTDVYGIRTWVRARISKSMDATVPAEEMLGDLFVELVEGQFVLALQELKLLRGNVTSEQSLLGAY
jgi:hypothetical protein